MMLLFELRAKVVSIYQRYDFWINLAVRFLLLYVAFSRIAKVMPYNATMCKNMTILLIALVSAFLPSGLMVVIAAVYVTLLIFFADAAILAVTVFALFMICYCFFLRFTSRQGASMIALPVLQSFGVPYILPILLGLFGNLLTIVPVCCGVFAYYTISYVSKNIETLAKFNLRSEPQALFVTMLDQLIKNPPMYVTMLILALVIVSVYFVRRINMDYAFEISIAVGTGVMMLGYIIADLRFDMGISIGGMVLASLLCGGISLVILFFYRVLQYSMAEHVEFEDDDYFYYVKAIPKIKAGAPRRKEKKVIRRRRTGEDDDDEEYEEAAIGLIDYSNKAAESLDAGAKKKLRSLKTEANDDDDDDDEDDIDDSVDLTKLRPKRYETRVGNVNGAVAAGPATGANDALFEDEDWNPAEEAAEEPEPSLSYSEQKIYAKKAAYSQQKQAKPAPAKQNAAPAGSAAPAGTSLFADDDDDDEDEQVIYDYFPEQEASEDEDYL